MSAAARLQNAIAKPQQSSNSGNAGLLLQRKCACGSPTPSLTGVCEECGSGKRLQAKLTIGASNDPLEQEADRVADQVLAAPANAVGSDAPPRIQRFTGQSHEQADIAPASVEQALTSPGRPLEPAIRQDMEQRFGHDFSQVRVHSGAAAEQSARDVNALAYTVRKEIVFGSGEYVPESSTGRHLLAHELTHVIQQRDKVAEGHNTLWIESRGAPEQQADIIAGRTHGNPPLRIDVTNSTAENLSVQRTERLSDSDPKASTVSDAGIDASKKASESDICAGYSIDHVDIAEAAAVFFVRRVLKRQDLVPKSIDNCDLRPMPYSCDVEFSNGMMVEVELSLDHVRATVSQADKEPGLIGRPVCTIAYTCRPSGKLVFSVRECSS